MSLINNLFFSLKFLVLFFILSAFTLHFAAPPAAAQEGADQYSRLKPKAKALFDRWAMLQNTADGGVQSSKERFNNLPVSRRSTYAAITNALLNSKLTDPATGKPLGFAIDLLEELETVAGREEGKRGDEQFRLYVKLKDDAVRKLDLSPEFIHDKDNTIFHKGYPTNYRQHGGAPTLQFSITTDGTRADVDIDYHSSGFPAALFNGHLKATNSDVRASGNYLTHLKR